MPKEVVLQCPKCGKDGLVRLATKQDVFECVYCRYIDDLNSTKLHSSESGQSSGRIGFIPFLVLVLLLTLLLF